MKSGLVVIARDVTSQVITRITSRRDLLDALQTARSVLRLKEGAVCVEVHHQEHPHSIYQGRPLAVLNRDDLPTEDIK
jgi:hypothetical protein